MKRRIGISTMLLVAGCAVAAPLQRDLVSAEALWVAHLDVDSFKRTRIGQQVLSEMEKPEVQDKLAAFQAIFSFDPRQDIQSLTLYGTGNQPKHGVLIIQGKFDTGRLLTLVKAAKDYQSTKHGTHVLHEYVDEKKAGLGRKDAHTVVALHRGRVIFGQTREAVAAALDVLDDKAANLESTAYFDQFSSVGPSFLQAATRKVEVPEGQPHSVLLRQAQYLSLTAGEGAGQMNVRLFALAGSEEVAQNMNQIGQGLIALMSLQTNKAAQASLAKATTLEQSGSQVTATLSLPIEQVLQWMQHRAAQKTRD